jgi:hypothetical protein
MIFMAVADEDVRHSPSQTGLVTLGPASKSLALARSSIAFTRQTVWLKVLAGDYRLSA